MDLHQQTVSRKEITLQTIALIIAVAILAGVLAFFGIAGVSHLSDIGLINVSVEAVGLVVSLTLLISCMLDTMQRGAERRWFLRLLFANHVVMGLDCVSYFIDGHPENRMLMTALMSAVYIFDFLVAYLFLQFMITAMRIRGKKTVRIISRGAGVLGIALGFLAFLNLFWALYFTVDEAGVYHRASIYIVQPLYAMLMSWFVLLFLVLYRKKLKRSTILAAVGYAVVINVGLVSTLIFTRLYIIYATNVLICLVLYILFNLESGNKGAVTERELSTAKMIQKSMLPDLFPDFVNVREFELYSLMSPAREVGGGFYDFFMQDETHFVFLIGDVSIQGVGAALFMAVAKSMISMRISLGGTPAEVLRDVNERIAGSKSGNVAAKVWLGVLDTATGRLIYSNAGHNEPAVLRAGEEDCFAIAKTEAGPPMGEKTESRYRNEETVLSLNDRLFLYNDGIAEATRKNGARFGTEKMLEILNGNRDKNNEALCHEMEQAVKTFLAGDRQTDDVTMLCFTFKAYKEDVEKDQA